jgi:hypothetical protein
MAVLILVLVLPFSFSFVEEFSFIANSVIVQASANDFLYAFSATCSDFYRGYQLCGKSYK